MQVLDLPDEIIAALAPFIRNIEDFNNARSSCRKLHRILSGTSPSVILHLAAASAPTFFAPHPHFLILATARQVSDWALGNPLRTAVLREHLQQGVDGLFGLCLRVGHLALDDIRRLHLGRFDFINPLADRIDKMAGSQWYETPEFWSGGASEAFTLYTEPFLCAFQYLIYGELFASSMQAYLEPQRKLHSFEVDVRFDYVKYCVPDEMCKGGFSGMEVKDTGPYAMGKEVYSRDQTSLQFVLQSGRWERLWQPLMRSIGPDFDNYWKQGLWWDTVAQTMGTWAAKALFCGPLPEHRRRLLKIRQQIEALTDRDAPKIHYIGVEPQIRISYAPDLAGEAQACMCKMWGRA